MANSTRPSGWIKWLVILLLLGAGGWAGYRYFTKAGSSEPQYQTAPVKKGDITQVVTANGQLNPVVNIQVGSQISGRIMTMLVDYNSEVKSNQVIAQIDPSTYQVAVQRAEAQLASAKANQTLARVQAERAHSLFTNNLIPASDHDIAQAQLQQAEAQVLQDDAAVQSAKVDLSRCTIYAPVDGVVISRNVDVGQTVAASFNTPTLFLIANDLTKMHIDALVSEADIGGVGVGQTVNFTVDAFPYRTFHGKVSQIRYGAITNQNVVNYNCIIDVNNDDQKLLPGMTASVSIVVSERNDVLRVPNSALRFRPPETTGAEPSPASRTNTQSGRPMMSQAGSPGDGAGGPRVAGESGQRGPGSGGGRGAGGFRGGAEAASGSVAGGGPGTAGGQTTMGSRPRPERGGPRTVYMLKPVPGKPSELVPVKIRTGITDGVNTELLDGLNEGDEVVTGQLNPVPNTTGPRPANPFGGGPRRF
jgi:HlyD family secretion protein